VTVTSNIKLVQKRFKKMSVKIGKSKSILGRAHVRAINRATATGRKAAVKDLSASSKIPQKALKRAVRFQRRDKAHKRKKDTTVFYHYAPVPARRLGKTITQTKRGAKVGRFKSFPGSFKGRMRRSGKQAIWRRVGKTRLPIEEVKVDLGKTTVPKVRGTLDKVVPKEYRKRMLHETSRELKKVFKRGRL